MASALSHIVYRTIQEAVITVLTAPENGSKKRPKHVEYYCSY